jgi:hypothetical protein
VSAVHGTFLWRGATMGVRGSELVEYRQAHPVVRFTFPSPIARASGVTQNVCIVVLEDGTIWQFLGEHTTRLVAMSSVVRELENLDLEANPEGVAEVIRYLTTVAAAATPPKEGP